MSGCLAVPAAALSVALEPIQDLHGYDNPWPAGGGKNKINAPDITLAAAGDIYNGACVLEAGTYTLSSSNTTVSVSVAGETGIMPITFTLANDISTIQIEASGAGTFNDIMIESGSTATTYEPYSNICPISGRTGTTVSTRNEDNTETASATISFGTTVYGGQVDFKTGVASITHVATSITGDNVSTISPQSAVDTEGGKRININIINAKYCGSGTGLSDIISDRLSVTSSNSIYNGTTPNRIAVNDAGGIVLRYAGAATAEAAEAALNANPVQTCYELATPIKLTLTPAQLTMLKGYNNISGDGVITITAYAINEEVGA